MIGQRIRRREDPRFLTGHGRFVDDLRFPGVRHATFVRSDWAHARIGSIDTSAAAQLPNTQVFTHADLDLGIREPGFGPGFDPRMGRPFLAHGVVRYVGEIVAVVVTETREQGVDAAELVTVDFEPLPVVVDPRQARQDEILLFDEVGTNVCFHQSAEDPDPALLSRCEVITRGTVVSQRVAVCPIEPRASVARVEPDGTLTVWVSSQTPHQDRDRLAEALGLYPDRVRVVAPDVGGGFGGKALGVEETIVAWLARATGRPIRWTETRSENMVGMSHGRAQSIEFELGGDREGRIEALRLRILQDAGAYPAEGAILPTLTALMASGVYRIGQIEVEIDSVVTNTTPTGAYRGAGRPEAAQVIERAVDMFAADLGLDPAEVRRRNFIASDAFPYTTAAGAEYDCGDYGQALELALEAVGYEELRAEQRRRRAAGEAPLLGVGLSTYVEITNGGPETEFGEVEITAEGDAVLKTGSFSHGQGHETTFAQIVAQRLGMAIERVTVVKGDTKLVARGTGTYGSKSTQIGGVAARQASDQLVEQAKRIAAEQLEADPRDMVLEPDTGRFHVTGAPLPALGWADLAESLSAVGRLEELRVQTDFAAPRPTFPFGAHAAVVEVDADTGKVWLLRLVAVDDAGQIINPMIADGQVHGGVASGIAQALLEEVAYDEDGNPQGSNFVSYCIPSAAEFPQFELIRMQTPTPVNPLGAKGIGESGTIGATPAVHNAVIDAVAHLGVRHLDMPVNGERVWRALSQAATDAR